MATMATQEKTQEKTQAETQEKTFVEDSIIIVEERTKKTIQEKTNESQQETTNKLLMAAFTYTQNAAIEKWAKNIKLKLALNQLYQTIIQQIQILIDHNKYNKLKDVYRSIRTITTVDNQPIKILLWKIYNYFKAINEPITASSPLPPLEPRLRW